MRLRVTLALSLLAPAFLPALTAGTAASMPPAESPAATSGYWTLGADGAVTGFGDATSIGDSRAVLGATPAVDIETIATGDGYWILDERGRVHPFGAAEEYGEIDTAGPPKIPADAEAPATSAPEQAVSLSGTATGKGYWIFTSQGKAMPFGDAAHHGDMAGKPLNAPVLDSVVTPSGDGYYMVASDGGIFTFGDASFHGSMGDTKLNAPVQSLVPAGDGKGYWLVASDGGIFSFEAPFKGSMGATRLNKPVTGMVRYGDGYLMVAEDGGIFNFSDQPFVGSLGDRPRAHPVVAVAAFDVQGIHPASEPSSPDPGDPGDPGQTTTTTGQPTTTTTVPATTTTTAPSGPWEDASAPSDLPEEHPTHVVPCNDGTGKSAVVWYHYSSPPQSPTGPWAAYNGCANQWLVVEFAGRSASEPYGSALSVAPEVHFADDPGNKRFSVDEEGDEQVSLSTRPLDGTRGCTVGYGMWKVEVDGEFEFIVACPTADDMGWYDDDEDDDDYDGPTCFGMKPDVIGDDEDQVFAAPPVSRPWVILGGGGNDVFRQDFYSGTTEVYFCGGDGNDEVEGYVTGFHGGSGEDKAVVYDCALKGNEPQVVGVEDVTWLPCPDEVA